MNADEFDKYVRRKPGVTVGDFNGTKRYLLSDKMFARISYAKNGREVLSVKAKRGRLEYYRNEYPNEFVPCDEIEPLHWNSVMLDCDLPDNVILAATDESYEMFYSELPYHTKKFLDENEPSYKYVLKDFDLQKAMRCVRKR